MKELHGFYNEETLIDLFEKGEITRLQMVCHQSPDIKEDYKDFCLENGLDVNEERSASLYVEERVRQEEEGEI